MTYERPSPYVVGAAFDHMTVAGCHGHHTGHEADDCPRGFVYLFIGCGHRHLWLPKLLSAMPGQIEVPSTMLLDWLCLAAPGVEGKVTHGTQQDARGLHHGGQHSPRPAAAGPNE